MTEFPAILDEANVLRYCKASGGQVTHYSDTGNDVPIRYYAIAHYPESPGFYLFSVSDTYQVIGDRFFDSVEEAIEDLKRDEEIEDLDWISLK